MANIYELTADGVERTYTETMPELERIAAGNALIEGAAFDAAERARARF